MLEIFDISLPFFAAAFYCISVAFIKLSSSSGKFSASSVLVINNIISGLVFIPQLFWGEPVKDWGLVWQPLLAGAFCALGNIATFLCAQKGELSLMTPIMGVKILIVLLLSHIFLSSALSASFWVSGIVCCVAVFIMGYSHKTFESNRLKITIFLALCACSSYAACDICIQKYAPNFTVPQMLALCTIMMPVSIIPYIPKFFKQIRVAGMRCISFGVLAGIFMVFECYLMFLSIVGSVGAALCNILYNTRGIMAVIMVLILGRYFGELKELSQASAMRRGLGALMILVAVFIVLM